VKRTGPQYLTVRAYGADVHLPAGVRSIGGGSLRAFVVGATGVLGRRIVRLLVERGHEVIGLARSPENERTLQELGARSARADLYDAEGLSKAAAGCEVMIRAATSIPTKPRTNASDWMANDRIRTEGTRAMMEAAAKVPARLYVHESIVWAAEAPGGGPFDEDAPLRGHPYLRATQEGERIALESGERLGIEVAILRCGGFYSADATHTRMFGQRLAGGRLPIVDGGRAVWSLIHADDAASAFAAAAEIPRSGRWHVVDDEPVSTATFFGRFAERLGGPPPRRISAGLARLAAGRSAVEQLTTSFPTSNRRLKRDFGWAPRFPTYREGIDEIVGRWRAEGFPAR